MRQKNYHLLLLSVFVIYLLLPTNNSSMDAYAYAGYVKYNILLFTPHHLLYNPFIYLINECLEAVSITTDILQLSKIINSSFAVINLMVIKNILKLQQVKQKDIIGYLLIIAFSFSLWRFGTENETYILPSTFSLLGSYYFLKFSKTDKATPLLLSGFFLAIACLFHQLCIFWWLGLLIGSFLTSKKLKTALLYSLPFIIVPISYLLTLLFYEDKTLTIETIQSFLFHDFQQGTADPRITLKGILFLGISVFRTFLQIHPNIYFLLQKNTIYVLPLLAGIYSCYLLITKLWRHELFKRQKSDNLLFVKTHLYIGMATLAFAFLIAGNIEFMTALPYLLVLCIAETYKINRWFLKTFALVLFIWNGAYGIVPNNIYSYYNDTVLLKHIIDHPENTYIIKNHFLKNQYFYETGLWNPDRIKIYNSLNSQQTEELLNLQDCIYTDIIEKPKLLNREAVFNNDNTANFLNEFSKTELLSYDGFYGTSKLYKICK